MSKKRCAYCRDYFDADGMVVRGLSAFCSNEHNILSMNEKRNQQAKRQKANKKETEIPQEIRDLVLELDGHRCRYCGQATNNLVPHHIFYRSEASNEPWLNEPVNLITLCNYPCHLDIVHGNKEVYQPLCKQIVYLRALKADRRTTIEQLEWDQNDRLLGD